MNGQCKLLYYVLNESFVVNILWSYNHSRIQLITNLACKFTDIFVSYNAPNPSISEQKKAPKPNRKLGGKSKVRKGSCLPYR